MIVTEVMVTGSVGISSGPPEGVDRLGDVLALDDLAEHAVGAGAAQRAAGSPITRKNWLPPLSGPLFAMATVPGG